jgi:hypothetical protein
MKEDIVICCNILYPYAHSHGSRPIFDSVSKHDDSTEISPPPSHTLITSLYSTALRPTTSTGCRASHPPSSGMMRISRKSRERCLSRRPLLLGYQKHQELWIGSHKL